MNTTLIFDDMNSAASVPVQNVTKENHSNSTFSIPESLFLLFTKNAIQANIDKGVSLIYLGTTEKMQKDFNQWRLKNSSIEMSPESSNLVTIISSIWMKTKTHIESELKAIKNYQEIMENEKQWQDKADQMEKKFNLMGLTGKFFTLKQAHFLINYSKSL